MTNSYLSVRAMSEKCNLSPARFYQLLKGGYFPQPLYCIRSHRPFYDLELQQICLQVKNTGIGYNGAPMLFYSPRKSNSSVMREKSNRTQNHKDIVSPLKQMGIVVTEKKVTEVIEEHNLSRIADKGVVIRELFKIFKAGV